VLPYSEFRYLTTVNKKKLDFCLWRRVVRQNIQKIRKYWRLNQLIDNDDDDDGSTLIWIDFSTPSRLLGVLSQRPAIFLPLCSHMFLSLCTLTGLQIVFALILRNIFCSIVCILSLLTKILISVKDIKIKSIGVMNQNEGFIILFWLKKLVFVIMVIIYKWLQIVRGTLLYI